MHIPHRFAVHSLCCPWSASLFGIMDSNHGWTVQNRLPYHLANPERGRLIIRLPVCAPGEYGPELLWTSRGSNSDARIASAGGSHYIRGPLNL